MSQKRVYCKKSADKIEERRDDSVTKEQSQYLAVNRHQFHWITQVRVTVPPSEYSEQNSFRPNCIFERKETRFFL